MRIVDGIIIAFIVTIISIAYFVFSAPEMRPVIIAKTGDIEAHIALNHSMEPWHFWNIVEQGRVELDVEYTNGIYRMAAQKVFEKGRFVVSGDGDRIVVRYEK